MGIIVKNSAKVSIINLIGVAIAAVSVLFIQTQYLTEKEIGAIKILNSLALAAFPFILMGFGSASLRFYHFFESNKKANHQFLTYIIFIPFLLLLICSGISLLLQDFIEAKFFANSPYLKNFIYILPGLIFYYVYFVLFESLLTIKAKIVIPNFIKSIINRLYLIVLIFIYAADLVNFDNLLILYVVLHIGNVALISYYYFRSIKFNYSPALGFQKNVKYREFSVYSLYVIFGSLAGVIVSQIDTLMTGYLLKDIGMVGVYSIAFFIGVVIETPKRPIIQMTIPIISKELTAGNNHEVEKLYKQSSINLFIVGALMFLVIWANIDAIFQILPNGEKYIEGKYVVFFIGLSKLFDLAVGINFEIIQFSKFYRWNILLTPFLAIMAIITNYFFIREYGIVGTAIATAISILVYNSVRSILVYYKLKMNSITYRHLIVSVLLVVLILLLEIINISNPFVSIAVKATVVSILFMLPILLLKISPEVNRAIKTVLKNKLNIETNWL